ncbi:MAG: aldo/keto reductase [Deltaproteobacteria bacterium]|nr:MAG: aldo/keto reductase [Deltaproteobacteria bacterium]
MEQRLLGRTGMLVSVLGFGGSEIGYEGISIATVTVLLNAAIDAGLNVIDTAECYVDSEELVGKAIAGRRNECYLFTKCGHPEGWGRGDWRPASILKSIERSLRRLQTDHLDLVQLHSCSLAELRQGDVLEVLQRARERGYTRFIGYSGDSQAARYAADCGQFDTLQTSVNIADQETLDRVLPIVRAKNMGVIAKRPVANVAWKTGKRPSDPYHDVYWKRLQKLKYAFLNRELNETIGIALRFTLSVPDVHTAIVGTTKPGRWQQNAALLTAGPLPQDQFEEIRARWGEVADSSWVGQI